MILTLIAFVAVMVLLIMVHELGHFITAKAANVKVKVYLSADNAFDSSDTLLTSKAVNIWTIKIKGAITKTFTYTSTTSPLGKYLIAVADPDNAITEADETNNTAISSAIQ